MIAPFRVLVVDDDPETRALVADFLQEIGYEVVGAADGLEAIRCLRQDPYDLVVSDLELPRLDGKEIWRVVKSLCPPPLFILMSGRPDLPGIARQAGIERYLAKPFELDALMALIRQATAAHLPLSFPSSPL